MNEEKNKKDEESKLNPILEESAVNDIVLESSTYKDALENETEKQETKQYPYVHNHYNLVDFQQALEEKDGKKIQEIVDDLPITIVAEYLSDSTDKQIVLFFKFVKTDAAAEIFSYLEPSQQSKVIEAFSNKEIQDLVSQMATDDLVDFVDELPSNLVNRVLSSTTKEDRRKINAFLAFKDDTAGSIMTTEYVHLKEDMTVKEAFDKVRKDGPNAESIQRLFVLDNSRILKGIVSLDELIFSEMNQKIADIMQTEYAFALTATDQEDVAELFKKYDLSVLPITNSEKRMLGIITVDDILDVLQDEQTEDMNKMSGIASKETKPYFKTSIWKTTISCFPWLIILLIVGTFTSLIMNKFEASLAILPILSVFVPSLTDTAGNSGSQSTTVITRAMSLKEITPKQWWKVLIKETLSGCVIGFIIGLFAFVWVLLETFTGIININEEAIKNLSKIQFQLIIASIVGLCIFIVIVMSRFFGAILPILAKLVHLDPAVMAGPLITTILDSSSLLIYFLLANSIIIPMIS